MSMCHMCDRHELVYVSVDDADVPSCECDVHVHVDQSRYKMDLEINNRQVRVWRNGGFTSEWMWCMSMYMSISV